MTRTRTGTPDRPRFFIDARRSQASGSQMRTGGNGVQMSTTDNSERLRGQDQHHVDLDDHEALMIWVERMRERVDALRDFKADSEDESANRTEGEFATVADVLRRIGAIADRIDACPDDSLAYIDEFLIVARIELAEADRRLHVIAVEMGEVGTLDSSGRDEFEAKRRAIETKRRAYVK